MSLFFPSFPHAPILLGRGVMSTWQLITANLPHQHQNDSATERGFRRSSLLLEKEKKEKNKGNKKQTNKKAPQKTNQTTKKKKSNKNHLEIHQLQAFLKDIYACGPTAALQGLLVRRPASLLHFTSLHFFCLLGVWHAAWLTTSTLNSRTVE